MAGLADQPIQSLSASPSRPAPSPVGAAVGLAGGVGRGLLGAVIKPIGGTAELVSQFGTGLLEGAGLSRQSVRRRMPLDHRTASFADGRLKYLEYETNADLFVASFINALQNSITINALDTITILTELINTLLRR